MSTSTLNLFAWRREHGFPEELDDDYADEVDRLRISRERGLLLPGADRLELPWSVDGFNTKTGQHSYWEQSYPTFEAAVADLPALWEEYVEGPRNLCTNCGEQPISEWEMCDSCIHNAKKSGWSPGDE